MSGSEATKAPIPKFASFRPRATLPAAKNDENVQASGVEPKGDRGRSHDVVKLHDSGHRHHHRSRKTDRDRTREVGDIEGPREQDKTMSDVMVKDEGSEIYFIDKKGDINNITYGTLHRYNIPHYFRTGHGRVIGLPPHYKIDRDVSEQQVLYINGRMTQRDSRKNKFYSKRHRETSSRILRVRSNPHYDPSIDASNDFIALSAHRSRKRRRVGDEDGPSSDEEYHHYRSIEGKAKAPNTIDEDLDLRSEASGSDEDTFKELSDSNKRLSIELSRAVESRPTDVNAWLALINHQESYLEGVEGSANAMLTYSEKRSLADLKVSIYEKAIDKVKEPQGKELLVLGMMEEGSAIWETKRLASRWRSVLQEHPGFIGLWVKYLDFQQTNSLEFAYDKCRSVFLDCLRILSSGSASAEDKEGIQTYVLLRMTLFMREAGFTEHATAIWQAVLELNFFRPDSLSPSQMSASLRASFEEFWESEAARIGEDGARGWRNTTNESVDPLADGSARSLNDTYLFESWVGCEVERMLQSRRPARTLDDVEEDDPYRVILYSDIQDFLILCNRPEARDSLIQHFLAFCQLPHFQTDNHAIEHQTAPCDPFVRNELLSQSEQLSTEWFPESIRDEGESTGTVDKSDITRKSPFYYPMQAFVSSVDTVFADRSRWFSTFISWNDAFPGNSGPVELDWLRRVLRALVNVSEVDDSLALYYLGFEAANDPKSAKKIAKALLKKRSSSLQLYNAYALIEMRSGNRSSADNVWSTAISMGNLLKDDHPTDCILLWRTWVWEALDDKDLPKALRLLLAIPTGKIVLGLEESSVSTKTQAGVSELLRARTFLTAGQEHAFSLRHAQNALYYTECLALLLYLTQGSEIEPALDLFRSASKSMSRPMMKDHTFLEELHQSNARLLYHHTTTTKYYKPAVIRKELEESIVSFPNNTIFLSLFAWLETRFRIDDRIRSVVRNPTFAKSTKDSVIGHFFSVETELHRTVSSGSTVHSSRAAFERAVDRPSGKYSAALWKLFLLFELRYGNPAPAKHVFYRGMRACPWAKPLIMLAFSHLRDIMTFEELRKVYNVLGERELRVHVDLEEAFERHDENLKRKRVDGVGERLAIELPDDPTSEEE